MKGIIDRFEGDFAVCEIDGQMKNLPRALFPEEAKEGDVFFIDNKVRILKDETDERKMSADNLFNKLKNKKVNA